MIDTTKEMSKYFRKTLRFFSKIVKRLDIAATRTEIGLMAFGERRNDIKIPMGSLKFEQDIDYKISSISQSERWRNFVDIASALKKVNEQVKKSS